MNRFAQRRFHGKSDSDVHNHITWATERPYACYEDRRLARLAADELYFRKASRFMKSTGISRVEFNDPVNQTLFEIAYPECREGR